MKKNELARIKRELINAAGSNKQERFLRSVAEKLKAVPPNGAEFLITCELALNDAKNNFDEQERFQLRTNIPNVARRVFSPKLTADIVKEWDAMKRHTHLFG